MGWEYLARCEPLDPAAREAVLDRVAALPFLGTVRRRPGELTFVWSGPRPADAWSEDGQVCVQTVLPEAVYVLFNTGVAADRADALWQAIHEGTGAQPFEDL